MKRRSKRSLKQDNDEDSLSKAIYMPLDITVDILSKLPLKSLGRFGCVSKLWYSSLITDSINTRSLTQPRLLVMFHNLYSSGISSSTYPLNTKEETITRDRDSTTHTLPCKSNCYFMYRYVRGLICFDSGRYQFTIYNVTTNQSVVLPKVKYDYSSIYFTSGLFGYDPVENQYKVLCFLTWSDTTRCACLVFTFPSRKKEEWRNVAKYPENCTQPHLLGTDVCINGILYYIGMSGDPLGRFNVRFERIDHIEMPQTLMKNDASLMKLVNYQEKLGCISFDYRKQTIELWIMEDEMEKKQEWSKITFFFVPPHLVKTSNFRTRICIAGVTRNGHQEIVIMPRSLKPNEKLYAYFHDPNQNETRRVELESTFETEVEIYCESDHIENTMSLVLTPNHTSV